MAKVKFLTEGASLLKAARKEAAEQGLDPRVEIKYVEIEKPVEVVREILVEVPKEVIKEVFVDRPVEVVREVLVDRPVEKIVEVIKEKEIFKEVLVVESSKKDRIIMACMGLVIIVETLMLVL